VAAGSAVGVELAMDLDDADLADRDLLLGAGFRLVDPRVVAGTPAAYRRYVQTSFGELCVAKSMYVDTRGGWFSDRSACYLASGRPVVAQDTGWTAALPQGQGLLAFHDTASAAAALAEVAGNPARHSRAAREVAEEHLSASVVLPALLDALGSASGAVCGAAA
jgi:glycosyltransferase involved in cell wall biosynthesis